MTAAVPVAHHDPIVPKDRAPAAPAPVCSFPVPAVPVASVSAAPVGPAFPVSIAPVPVVPVPAAPVPVASVPFGQQPPAPVAVASVPAGPPAAGLAWPGTQGGAGHATGAKHKQVTVNGQIYTVMKELGKGGSSVVLQVVARSRMFFLCRQSSTF